MYRNLGFEILRFDKPEWFFGFS